MQSPLPNALHVWYPYGVEGITMRLVQRPTVPTKLDRLLIRALRISTKRASMATRDSGPVGLVRPEPQSPAPLRA